MTITLKEIYDEFLELEMVSNQADFSEFLGKKPSWYSSTVSHSRGITLDSLCRISWRLKNIYLATLEAIIEAEEEDVEAFENGLESLQDLIGRVQQEIDGRMPS